MATLKSIKNKYLQTSDGDTLGVSDNSDNVALLAFKMQAADSIAKFNMVDGFSDAYADASGIDASASTNEIRNATGFYSASEVGTVTGGTISDYSTGGVDYKVHTFTSDGDFVVSAGSATISYLIVGGGGAGGGVHGGGGGAGGVLHVTSETCASGTYAAVVGDGGARMTTCRSGQAQAGDDSTFKGQTADGGGRGGKYGGTAAQRSGGAGGSGGGGGAHSGPEGPNGSGGSSSQSDPINGVSGTGYGNVGAAGSYGGGDRRGNGGGGGAGEAGNTDGTMFGGDGVQINIDGNNYYVGGGGGGGDWNGSGNGAGGDGGGGGGGAASGGSGGAAGGGPARNAGTAGASNAHGGDAGANTGSGGGGSGQCGHAGFSGRGGAGGSGIVQVRYVEDSFVSYLDLTLVSNSVTAAAQPDTADIVATYTNGAGTATLNTDIKYYVSRDNGTTYTEATMVSQGTSGGHSMISARNIDISGQPAGTTMRYKVTTHNQSAAKETRAQAVSLAWA